MNYFDLTLTGFWEGLSRTTNCLLFSPLINYVSNHTEHKKSLLKFIVLFLYKNKEGRPSRTALLVYDLIRLGLLVAGCGRGGRGGIGPYDSLEGVDAADGYLDRDAVGTQGAESTVRGSNVEALEGKASLSHSGSADGAG